MRVRHVALILAGIAALAPTAAGAEKKERLSPEERKALAAAEKEARKEHDAAVKAAIDAFKKALRSARTDNEQAAAILRLGQEERDPKIVATLRPFLVSGGDLTRGEAISAIRAYRKDRLAAVTLLAALPANKSRDSIYERILSALGAVGHASCLPVLIDRVKDRNARVAVAAANGLGETNAPAAIEPLLDALKRLERDSKGGGIGGIAGNEGQTRHKEVSPAILAALKSLTGEELKDHAAYESWWLKHKATFKPKPEESFQGICPNHQPKIRKGDRLVPLAAMGGILREFWRNVNGGAVKDLTGHTLYKGPPSTKNRIASFDAPAKMGSNYGQRFRGYLHPPADGDYVFAVACDDAGELWLSTDDDPANKVLVCKTEKAIGRREFDKAAPSAPVTLKRGKVYYIEALHKQGGQGDHFAVGWKASDGKAFDVIAGRHLSPLLTAGP